MNEKEGYSTTFAENLRRFRQKQGLTQLELGRKINYSEKAVSKWESGSAIPPATALLAVSDVLGVTLDDLFEYGTPSYYLGIDGGATKTTFALADNSGNIIRTIRLGSSNPFDLGFSAASAVLDDGIRKVTDGISFRKISMYAGLSGGSSGDSKEKLEKFFKQYGFLSASSGPDIENILMAGLGSEDGMALIMGTGSSAFVQKDGVKYRIGGYGYLFDHGGCGYDIGNAAISSALKSEDGSGEPTIILNYLKEDRNCDRLLSELSYFYSIGKSGIASYAPIVFKAYSNGDKVACNILKNNMAHIANMLKTGRRKLEHIEGEITKVVAVGGLTKDFDILEPMLNAALDACDNSKNYNIKVYDGDVVRGALLIAEMPNN